MMSDGAPDEAIEFHATASGVYELVPIADPCPDPVDGAALLDELVAAIRRYVVMNESDACATALWIVYTYAYDLFYISPRLAITSPQKRCGKTTLIDVLARLVSRPLTTANTTAAALYRTIEAERPTLLID